MDVAFENQEEVSVDDYLLMIRKKTAQFFITCMKIGALAGELSQSERESLENFGLNLGLAFQIQDDILGLFGEQDELGKPIGSDLRKGKKTYLVISALEVLDTNAAEELKFILQNENKADLDIERGLELIEKSGAKERASDLGNEYVDKAIESLTEFPDNESKRFLIALANSTRNRKN